MENNQEKEEIALKVESTTNENSTENVVLKSDAEEMSSEEREAGGADKNANAVVTVTPQEAKKMRRDHIIATVIRYVKMISFVMCWLIFTVCLIWFEEHESLDRMITVPANESIIYEVPKNQDWGLNVVLRLTGIFKQFSFKYESKNALISERNGSYLEVVLQEKSLKESTYKNITNAWFVFIQNESFENEEIVVVERVFELQKLDLDTKDYAFLFRTNLGKGFPMEISTEICVISRLFGLGAAVILLSSIYIYLVFDLIHRTMSGVICCTLGIGLLASMRMRQDLMTLMHWLPIDTLMHYFGMSIVMAVLSETGLQDYLAATGYQLSNGHIWPLLNVLLLTSAILSLIFNNITIALFITPVCLRLCEIMSLNHVPILVCLMIALNVGQALTPLTASTNGTIRNHPSLDKKISGEQFVLHMFIPVLLAAGQSYLHLRLLYVNSEKMRILPEENQKYAQQIRMLRKASITARSVPKEKHKLTESLSARFREMNARLQRLGKMPTPPPNYEQQLKSISHYFTLRNVLFLVAGLGAIMVMFIFTLFTLFPKITYLSDGWTAMTAAMLALTIVDLEELDMVLNRIDWGTMIFIATQFILMEVLVMLGFLESIGLGIDELLLQVNENYKLVVGILIIISISALLTTIMDNTPVAHMMVRVISTLTYGSRGKNLPSSPLIWALALGCNLGGNGSLVASLGNITCSGVAAAHGHPVSFLVYLFIAFPVMLGSIATVSIYLLIAYAWFGWV